MGSRWTLSLHCAHCGEGNDDVYYAPTCGFFSFRCKKCGKQNWIEENFSTTTEETLEAMENRLAIEADQEGQ